MDKRESLNRPLLISAIFLILIIIAGFVSYYFHASAAPSGNNNAQIASSKSQIEFLTDQNNDLKNQLAAIRKQNNDLQIQASTLNDQNVDLQGQTASLNDQNIDLKNQLSAIRKQNNNLQIQASALNDQNVDLQGQTASLNKQISDLKSQISSLSSQNSNLHSQVSSLNSQNADLQSIIKLSKESIITSQRTIHLPTNHPTNPKLPANQTAGVTALVASFKADYAGYVTISGTSTTSDGYILLTLDYPWDKATYSFPSGVVWDYGRSLDIYNKAIYKFNNNTTLKIPILPGEIYITFGNNSTYNPVSATITVKYIY